MIADIEIKGLADTSFILASGISRGGYIAVQVAANNPNINYLVLMSPVTDLKRLKEFSNNSVDPKLYGLQRFYKELSLKHLYLQIGNSDSRVGTAEALEFILGVVKAGGENIVDLTGIITAEKGHASTNSEEVRKWVAMKVSLKPKKKLRPLTKIESNVEGESKESGFQY